MSRRCLKLLKALSAGDDKPVLWRGQLMQWGSHSAKVAHKLPVEVCESQETLHVVVLRYWPFSDGLDLFRVHLNPPLRHLRNDTVGT